MTLDEREWTKMTRRTKRGTGGAHVYIDGNTLYWALRRANIDPGVELECRRYPTSGSGKTAQIILRVREKKQ